MREPSQEFDPRQVMKNEDYEIFHYRDARPGNVEIHHHDFFEVYFLLEGQLSYWVEDRVVHMIPGDLLFINPMELHRPMPDPRHPVSERFVLWLQRHFLEELALGPLLLDCFDTSRPTHTHLIRPSATDRAELTACMGELVRECYSKDFGSELSAHGLLLQLMVKLNRLSRRADGAGQDEPLSELVRGAIQFISENLSSDLSLERIAGHLFISKYHLSHAFTREVGISVYRYIVLKRLLMARQLLREGQAAAQVCRSCGFSDYTAFYRAFKSEYGISPKQFTAN